MIFLEPHVQMPRRVFAEPGEEELVGLGDAMRRVTQAFPFPVFAYGNQYLPDGAFDPGPVTSYRKSRILPNPLSLPVSAPREG